MNHQGLKICRAHHVKDVLGGEHYTKDQGDLGELGGASRISRCVIQTIVLPGTGG